MKEVDSTHGGGSIGTGTSRRRFLGGSMAAAIGSLSANPFTVAEVAAQAASTTGGVEALKPTGPIDEAYWQKIRKEFNIVDDMTYMNTGSLGPMPRTVFDANIRYLREIAEDPRRGRFPGDVRSKVAAFVGADPDEICLTRSTTEGIKVLCAGLDLKMGDEVLMSSHEHWGGYGPWRAREKREGIKVSTVVIPAPPESADQVIDMIEKAITPKTRVLVVSHPIYVTGLLMPIKGLAEMAHRNGLVIVVDGAHAVGMLDLNFHDFGVDFYAASGQKWLMAGTGTGVAYFKRDLLPKVWSDMTVSPFAPVVENDDPNMRASKFERSGQRDIPSLRGMGDAIDFHNAIGKKNVEARVQQLAARLKNGLAEIPGVKVGTPMSPELSGGLTTLSIEGVPQLTILKVFMEREGIFIPRSRLNASAFRISTHIYNSPAEVDRVLAVVKHIAENASKYKAAV